MRHFAFLETFLVVASPENFEEDPPISGQRYRTPALPIPGQPSVAPPHPSHSHTRRKIHFRHHTSLLSVYYLTQIHTRAPQHVSTQPQKAQTINVGHDEGTAARRGMHKDRGSGPHRDGRRARNDDDVLNEGTAWFARIFLRAMLEGIAGGHTPPVCGAKRHRPTRPLRSLISAPLPCCPWCDRDIFSHSTVLCGGWEKGSSVCPNLI
jgi:hypothetical protein